MTKIIRVDFKKKEKIQEHETSNYTCSICKAVYMFDSRHNTEEQRVKRIEAKVGKSTVVLCHTCVNEMYTLLNDSCPP